MSQKTICGWNGVVKKYIGAVAMKTVKAAVVIPPTTAFLVLMIHMLPYPDQE
jgi:hypothetical protein